jgi:hypothetical protein
MGHVNRTLILKHHQARTHAQELVRLFTEVAPRTSAGPPVTEARELARQVRLRWRSEGELFGLRAAFQAEADRHTADLERERARSRRLRRRHAALMSHPWVRLGRTLRLVPRPFKETR